MARGWCFDQAEEKIVTYLFENFCQNALRSCKKYPKSLEIVEEILDPPEKIFLPPFLKTHCVKINILEGILFYSPFYSADKTFENLYEKKKFEMITKTG